MGSALFEIGEILGARGCIKAKKLRNGGTLFVRITKAEGTQHGNFNLALRGIKLKNVEGMFSKSDPFFVVSAQVDAAGGRTWQPVARSEAIQNNLNPVRKERLRFAEPHALATPCCDHRYAVVSSAWGYVAVVKEQRRVSQEACVDSCPILHHDDREASIQRLKLRHVVNQRHRSNGQAE